MPGILPDNSGGGLFSNLLKIGASMYLGNLVGGAFGLNSTGQNILGSAIGGTFGQKKPSQPTNYLAPNNPSTNNQSMSGMAPPSMYPTQPSQPMFHSPNIPQQGGWF